ncbi:Alpha/Beta hydrolase protein [Geopyxis carbonaria]|nr:Alpha/Beta hydrolase protein [Geopyxis carbonaria]
MTNPAIVHASKTVLLRTTTGTVPLSSFTTPLIPPYTSNPLLFNGHLQTIWSVSNLSDPFPVHYARKHYTNPSDGGHFAVDFVVPAPSTTTAADAELPPRTRHMTDTEAAEIDKGAQDVKPMVVALHGLSGGSHEKYLRAVLAPLTASGEFEACVINARGCALSKITSTQLFNAKFTGDIRLLLKHLREVYPHRPLFAVGFSLGANILTNYLGEQGHDTPLTAAAVISNPWNLELTDKALHRTLWGHHIYSPAMGAGLRRLYTLHSTLLNSHPLVLPDANTRMVHARDFDREITCKIFGYPTVGAYYRAASSVDNLLKVRVPLLVLQSKDDPIAIDEAVPYDEVRANRYVVMAVTGGGGHLGWFEMGGGRWFGKPVAAFFGECVKQGVTGVEEVEDDEWKVEKET